MKYLILERRQGAKAKTQIKPESGGSGEIRTHGQLPVAGFQDQCLKPLGHASYYFI